jgi:hypothetical protein
MRLLDDIIDAATNDDVPVGTLLRKCLVLERLLRNEKFKAWLDLELDGYDNVGRDELPDYRVFNCINRGDFLGSRIQASAQPISLHMLTEQEREMMGTVELKQPAAAYETPGKKHTDAIIPWNQSLVVKYQRKIYQGGDPILVKAWQEIPGSVLTSLVDQIRTRVLRFALDLKDSSLPDAATLSNVPVATIEKYVVNNFYGGNNLVATNTVHASQAVQQSVTQNDLPSLVDALKELGVTKEGTDELTKALEHSEPETKMEMAKRWAGDMAKHIGKEGAKVSLEIAKQTALRWISQYLGHPL